MAAFFRISSPAFCRVFALRLILFGATAALAAQQANETLTNDAVIRMVKAHLTTSVIVTHIQQNPGEFDLSTDGLIGLKTQGVQPLVIAAMQAKAKIARPAATRADREKKAAIPSPSKPPSLPEVPHPYRWQVYDDVDRMNNSHHVVGTFSQRPRPGTNEELVVKATCDGPQMHWIIDYESGTNPGLTLAVNYPTTSGGGGGNGIVLGGVGGIMAGLLGMRRRLRQTRELLRPVPGWMCE